MLRCVWGPGMVKGVFIRSGKKAVDVSVEER